jgi:vacuolar protein sorting-associated protein 13A/C
MKIPKLTLMLEIEELVGRLEERQFSSVQDLALFFTNYIKSRPFISLRPTLPVSAAPKQWWKFLHEAIFKQVREKREKWTWAYFKKRKADRVRYIQLWRLHKLNKVRRRRCARAVAHSQFAPQMSEAEKNELAKMEVDLAFDDIILYRSLSDALLKGEKKKRDEEAKKQSWWSWAVGGGGPALKEEKVAELNQEDWQRLYTAINFEDKPVVNQIEPPEVRVSLHLFFSPSLVVHQDPHFSARYTHRRRVDEGRP